MADFVDPCCVASTMAVQLTKPDKNNNTTANVDDGIIVPLEQCDVTEDGLEEKFDSTGDCDDRPVSSGADDDETSNSTRTAPSLSTTDVQPVSISSSYSNNPNNNSSNNTSTNTPMTTSNSDPYKDFSGVDTESFISTTLRNNPKDRFLLLRLGTVLQEFIQTEEKTSHQFQAMNSYERMIVHRVAAFFGLDHNVDKNGQAVVVTKTANTRIPDFSFQKCIPEGESSDPNAGAFATDASLSSNSASNSNPTDIPTRRILRRHEKTSNHEHSTRNGLNDEHSHPHSSSTSSHNKHSSTYKPYSERVNNYAETRARIFNETPNMINTDGSNSTTLTMNNKTQKSNGKGNTNIGRPSYRKSQPNHHQNQQRSYLYPHSQTTTNSHLQTFATGKTMDPSSHLINSVAGRAPLYSSHQMATQNLSMAQASLYGPMVASPTNTGPIRVPVPAQFYSQGQQAPIDYDYKQSIAGAHIYNYVPMIPQPTSNYLHQQSQQQQQQQAQAQAAGQTQGLTSVTTNNPNQVPSQHGTSIQIPILLHQQPTGQIQYLFPAQALQQQQQAQQAPQPSSANPYPLTPDGQYVQVYRPDGLSIAGAGPAVLENNPNHHHPHHHAYPPTPTYHHHPGHPLNQPQQVPPEVQQPQQVPPQSQATGPTASQTNLATQPGSYLRLYSTGTPANLSHPYPQATYPTGAPHPPGSFVQSGPLPPGSYMISTQTPGAVPSYPTFDNGSPYPTAYVQSVAPTNTGKNGMNNPQVSLPPSVQYATNHLSNLSLQANPHDDYQARLMNSNPNPRYTHPNGSTTNHVTAAGPGPGGQPRNFIGRPLVQSPNGTSPTSRMPMYPPSNHPYRPARPYNLANTDKTMPSVNENDPKTTPTNQHATNTSESISLAGPAQE